MMGHQDLMRLYPIVKQCRALESQYEWGFTFRWDQGSFETAIEIFDDGRINYPPRMSRSPYNESGDIFCPDILVQFKGRNVAVIEYEEEAKPNRGAKRRKGHFEGNKRDSLRDGRYKVAKIDLLKIWESNKEWEKDLKKFLVVLYCKRMTWAA